MDMYTFLDTLIQGMQVIEGIGSLLLVIALLLEEIWWLGGTRKKMCLAQVQAEYRVMAHIAFEMVWLKNLLMELGFRQPKPMSMHCDNQFIIYTV